MTADRIDRPRAGFFRTRLARGGIYVGVRFWVDTVDRCWRVEVDGRLTRTDGQPLDPLEVWPWCAGQEITEREFNFLARRRQWAEEHAPDHPAANPEEPVDLSKLPPRF
jgi:hypothetical protein